MTKGNFALNATREIRPHENNLRFHIKIDEKYYEFAIDQINKTTVNIRCVVGKTKNSPKCDSFDHFNGSERKQNLLEYLGLFSRRDSCPEEYYED